MLYLIFIFALGTVVGSFLNVCIHRLPRGESIVFPASHCPNCKRALNALDLIPVLGYFLLRGRCRYCCTPISLRYPVVEFVCGLLFVGMVLAFPLQSRPLDFAFYLIFTLLLLVIFFTDLEHQVVPDSVSVSGIFLGLFYNYIQGMFFHRGPVMNPFVSAIFGMLLGYVLFYLIAVMGKWWFKKEAMGEGDLYLAAFLGAYLGWEGVLLSVFIAYFLAGLVLLMLLLSGRIKMEQYVPFGPALTAGGMIYLFFGPGIISWYMSFFI